MKRQEVLMEEFKEAGHLHRLHITLLFGQSTVFLGATGALLHRLTDQPQLCPGAVRLLGVAGVVLSIAFLLVHLRIYAHSHKARCRAKSIQYILDLSLYVEPWPWLRVPITNLVAVGIVFCVAPHFLN